VLYLTLASSKIELLRQIALSLISRVVAVGKDADQ
jgi:hypothetical protein